MDFILKDIDEWGRVAGMVIQKIPDAKSGAVVVFLRGNLGAGKTTLVQSITQKLGIKEVVNSPTFNLIKFYDFHSDQFTFLNRLIHIDAYRISPEDSIDSLRLDRYFDQENNLIIIEWPDNIKDKIKKPDIEIDIKFDEMSRQIKIKP